MSSPSDSSAPKGPGNPIDQFVVIVDGFIRDSWNTVREGVPEDVKLQELPQKVAVTVTTFVESLYDHLTLFGNLPLPQLPTIINPSPTPPAPAQPPPTTRSTSSSSSTRTFLIGTATIGLFVLGTGIGGATYLCNSRSSGRGDGSVPRFLLPFFRSFVPILPRSISQPSQQTRTRGKRPLLLKGSSGRVEVALVLGADRGTLGREIALDLVRKGFIVVASVADEGQVDGLEREGRGWIRALVLDPRDPSYVTPFLRSLTSSLSLRYPLNSPGDPFTPSTSPHSSTSSTSTGSSSSSRSPTLTTLINCLPLQSSHPVFRSEKLGSELPVEGTELGELVGGLNEVVVTSVGIVKGVLPLLRTGSVRLGGGDESVVLTLTPSNTSNLDIPFQSIESASVKALGSIMSSLRRELRSSESVRRQHLRSSSTGTRGEGGVHPYYEDYDDGSERRNDGVRIVELEVGNILPSNRMVSHAQSSSSPSDGGYVVETEGGEGVEDDRIERLPHHLKRIYGPILRDRKMEAGLVDQGTRNRIAQRQRLAAEAAQEGGSSSGAGAGGGGRRRRGPVGWFRGWWSGRKAAGGSGTTVEVLTGRVFDLAVGKAGKSFGGEKARVGRGAWKHLLASFIPSSFITFQLSFTARLTSILLQRRDRVRAREARRRRQQVGTRQQQDDDDDVQAAQPRSQSRTQQVQAPAPTQTQSQSQSQSQQGPTGGGIPSDLVSLPPTPPDVSDSKSSSSGKKTRSGGGGGGGGYVNIRRVVEGDDGDADAEFDSSSDTGLEGSVNLR